MMRPARAAAVLVSALALLVVAGPAASAKWGLPDALTERGRIVEDLFGIVLILSIITFAIVFVWLVLLIVRFREGTGHGRTTNEKERHSMKAEIAWFGVPLIMVMYIGYAAYGGLVQLDHGIALEDAEMEVRIVGSQWNWLADYGSGVEVFANPDPNSGHVAAENVFLVPQDTPLLLNITAADVIHAFQVLDANRAYVLFNDANPLGLNKYALQTVSFPAGDYFVQCNKFCLNPGHAYMHAAIRSVPQAEFDHWFFGKKAEGGAPLLEKLTLRSTADGLRFANNGTLLSGSLTVAAQTRIVVDLADTAADVTLKAVGVAEKTIPAGEMADTYFAFDVTQPGSYTLTGSNGGSLAITAIEAIPKRVEMGNFEFQPGMLQLEVGKTYLIQVPNTHSATHDLHIGTYKGGSGDVIVAKSPSVGGGGTSAFLITPTVAGTFDMWCSQSGHVGLGMVNLGGVTVT
ncbi:MAG: hypothetical protein AABX89_02150 [Candidatus Thermoplasmatota archaeon]